MKSLSKILNLVKVISKYASILVIVAETVAFFQSKLEDKIGTQPAEPVTP